MIQTITLWSQDCGREGAIVATVEADGSDRPALKRISLDSATNILRAKGYVFASGGQERFIGEIGQFANTFVLEDQCK